MPFLWEFPVDPGNLPQALHDRAYSRESPAAKSLEHFRVLEQRCPRRKSHKALRGIAPQNARTPILMPAGSQSDAAATAPLANLVVQLLATAAGQQGQVSRGDLFTFPGNTRSPRASSPDQGTRVEDITDENAAAEGMGAEASPSGLGAAPQPETSHPQAEKFAPSPPMVHGNWRTSKLQLAPSKLQLSLRSQPQLDAAPSKLQLSRRSQPQLDTAPSQPAGRSRLTAAAPASESTVSDLDAMVGAAALAADQKETKAKATLKRPAAALTDKGPAAALTGKGKAPASILKKSTSPAAGGASVKKRPAAAYIGRRTKSKKLLLGCSRCRGSSMGCVSCRDPCFAGVRFQRG